MGKLCLQNRGRPAVFQSGRKSSGRKRLKEKAALPVVLLSASCCYLKYLFLFACLLAVVCSVNCEIGVRPAVPGLSTGSPPRSAENAKHFVDPHHRERVLFAVPKKIAAARFAGHPYRHDNHLQPSLHRFCPSGDCQALVGEVWNENGQDLLDRGRPTEGYIDVTR